MFTLSAVPVKFVGLLVLFAFTTAYEGWRTVRADSATGRTSHGLHLLMSVIMLLMVPKSWWVPFKSVVPVPVSIALMVVGVLWFARLALRGHGHGRAHATGCALMFTAMVWHLAAMMVKMHNMTSMSGKTGGSATPMPSMAGMDHGSMAGMSPSPMASPMAGMDHSQMASGGHGTMWWMALIGIPLMAYLLWASFKALAVAFTKPGQRVSALADFAMNFGMFWMSTGLLVSVAPFMGLLSA